MRDVNQCIRNHQHGNNQYKDGDPVKQRKRSIEAPSFTPGFGVYVFLDQARGWSDLHHFFTFPNKSFRCWNIKS